MLYRISVTERGLTGIANIFRSRLSRLDDLLGAGTVPLNSLDANKSTGPDGIPVILLKLIALLIAKPLSQLFKKSLLEGRFPSTFKEANIKPIYKNKGAPSDHTCYRPISILSALSEGF